MVALIRTHLVVSTTDDEYDLPAGVQTERLACAREHFGYFGRAFRRKL